MTIVKTNLSIDSNCIFFIYSCIINVKYSQSQVGKGGGLDEKHIRYY